MFGWFKRRPHCGLEPEYKRWIDERFQWLVSVFGRDRLMQHHSVAPTAEFFPDKYESSEAGAQKLFEQVCNLMMVAPESLEFRIHAAGHRPHVTGDLQNYSPGFTGLYERRESANVVFVDRNILRLPEVMVSTLAHEISHELLLGRGHLTESDEDHEFVTDLTVAFMGFGIFGANVSFEDRSRINWRGEEIGSAGYLTPDAWAYALALRAVERGETATDWDRWLRRFVREKFRSNFLFLTGKEFEDQNKNRIADEKPTSGFFDIPTDEEAEQDLLHGDATTVLLLEANELIKWSAWNEALACLNKVVNMIPDEAEPYQLRALVYIELGLYVDALADSERAIEIEPDEYGSRFARGRIALELKEYSAAKANLIRCVELSDVHTYSGMQDTSRALWLLGVALLNSGDPHSAVQKLNEAVRAFHDWPQPYETRAAAYAALGETVLEQRDLEEARRREQR